MQGGARVAHHRRTHDHPHGQRGQHERGERTAGVGPARLRKARRGQDGDQPRSSREQQDEDQATPQGRHGATHNGRALVDGAGARGTREHGSAPGGDADRKRDDEAQNDEREGDGGTGADEGGHGLSGEHGGAEVAAHQTGDPRAVLHDQRAVEAHLRAQCLHAFGWRVEAGHDGGDVAGQHAQRQEDHHGDGEERHNKQQQPAYKVFHSPLRVVGGRHTRCAALAAGPGSDRPGGSRIGCDVTW